MDCISLAGVAGAQEQSEEKSLFSLGYVSYVPCHKAMSGIVHIQARQTGGYPRLET